MSEANHPAFSRHRHDRRHRYRHHCQHRHRSSHHLHRRHRYCRHHHRSRHRRSHITIVVIIIVTRARSCYL